MKLALTTVAVLAIVLLCAAAIVQLAPHAQPVALHVALN